MNTFIKTITIITLSALLLTGCLSQSLPEERLPEFSVISVQLPGFEPQRGDTVSWLNDLVIAGDLSAEVEELATVEITSRVEQRLSEEGFIFVAPANSQYVLLAALIGNMSNELLDEQKQLLELARMYPMLGGGAYERDMLILALTTPEKVGDGNPLWKAAVEVYSADELNLNDAAKLKRLDAAINQLLSTLPYMM
ncbi:hypothetical protein R0137_08135 [Congregibacter brevis]|uniref:DUF4136 domain-containing protein n=1 Tax=Congregibacter brevis TaxID=3081201 RepID=A0ABZ0IIM2_9GAMM|nr:hypothetical protein R0137_08135 [Congregibacter sp. IMCC45268]